MLILYSHFTEEETAAQGLRVASFAEVTCPSSFSKQRGLSPKRAFLNRQSSASLLSAGAGSVGSFKHLKDESWGTCVFLQALPDFGRWLPDSVQWTQPTRSLLKPWYRGAQH